MSDININIPIRQAVDLLSSQDVKNRAAVLPLTIIEDLLDLRDALNLLIAITNDRAVEVLHDKNDFRPGSGRQRAYDELISSRSKLEFVSRFLRLDDMPPSASPYGHLRGRIREGKVRLTAM